MDEIRRAQVEKWGSVLSVELDQPQFVHDAGKAMVELAREIKQLNLQNRDLTEALKKETEALERSVSREDATFRLIEQARTNFLQIVSDSCTDRTILGKRVYAQAKMALEQLAEKESHGPECCCGKDANPNLPRRDIVCPKHDNIQDPVMEYCNAHEKMYRVGAGCPKCRER